MARDFEGERARRHGEADPVAALDGLGHDLYNVLSAAIGYAEILADDASRGSVDPRDADQLVVILRRAVELARAMTDDGKGGGATGEPR